ncbi:factor of DNA methylation 2-like [Humulus lupulus]|uniref:factor of DNA methylation 2-like n=1 Tax=Humulus lupulus TaxID=3486 RepID=UPI002B4042F5|nr:factor of DNA methylation 2-like [Humulus lupulus]XP_062088209.1 factor of DNA methylation 2-like [Humulus lupulus]XP_062088211.1 factor of DNA methylation 2-like [Humulus lupulus]
MEKENLEELQRRCSLFKEISQLYEANYEEKKKVQDLKQRLEEVENEQKLKKKNKTVLKESSDSEEEEAEAEEEDEPEAEEEEPEAEEEDEPEAEEEEPEADKELVEALIANERKIKDELSELRRLFINHFKNASTSSGPFGVKRMGELNSEPFTEAMESRKDNHYEAMQKCTLWSKYIRDPHWHPFKVVNIRGKPTEVVDGEDKKLKGLKKELGENVYEAVKAALVEMNEYNPSGRFPVPELWNLEEDRKASLKDVIEFILDGWTPNKRLRRR